MTDGQGDSREPMQLRGLYSVDELACFARICRQKLRRLLLKAGVQFVRSGRTAFIPLSQGKEKILVLRKSMCALEEATVRARERARTEEE